jgi:hypothetical protein
MSFFQVSIFLCIKTFLSSNYQKISIQHRNECNFDVFWSFPDLHEFSDDENSILEELNQVKLQLKKNRVQHFSPSHSLPQKLHILLIRTALWPVAGWCDRKQVLHMRTVERERNRMIGVSSSVHESVHVDCATSLTQIMFSPRNN